MHNQRGFVGVSVLIAIVLGLIVVGGGAYYVTHPQTSSQIPPETVSGNPDLEQNGATQNNPTLVQWKTYSSKEYGFSVNYPSDWRVNDQSYTYQGERNMSVEISSSVRNLPQYKQYALGTVRFSVQIYFKDGKKSLG